MTRVIDAMPGELLHEEPRILSAVGECFSRIAPVVRPLDRDDRIMVCSHVLALVYLASPNTTREEAQ